MQESMRGSELHEYFMRIAMAVRKRANCVGNKIGAILTISGRIVSTGFNGTPENMLSCEQGGCHRCAHREKYPSGTAYDLCICVHAEQNAILAAAKFGIALDRSVMYTTMQPCFNCSKEMLQAGVYAVYYLHPWNHPDPEYKAEYQALQNRFPGGIHAIEMEDPDASWAVSRRGSILESVDTKAAAPR